jgi:hypothetical protein
MTVRLTPLASLLACLFALTLGCMKASAPEGAYYPGGGESYGGYADDDGSYAEPAPAEYVMEESDARGRSGKSKGKKESAYRSDKLDSERAPSPEPVTTETTVTRDSAVITPTPDEPEPIDEPTVDESDARQIIYTASLQLAVYELDETMAFAEDIPRRHGGWIQARYDYQITLRVPADHLQAVIAELAELGVVLGKTLQADDVTAQYTDLEARIAVLEQLVEQLEILLKQAKTVEDSLKVRQELERVRIELESAKAQMRQLAESISFSTLTIILSARGPVETLPSSNDPFPWVDDLGVESTEFR